MSHLLDHSQLVTTVEESERLDELQEKYRSLNFDSEDNEKSNDGIENDNGDIGESAHDDIGDIDDESNHNDEPGYDDGDDSSDYGESVEGTETAPKRRGRSGNPNFPSEPLGNLSHPYLGWVLDKASMDEYMHSYAKQEGFAVNFYKEHGGTVIRYRCIHAGKYNNFRKLPAQVTNKRNRQSALALGIHFK